MYGLHTEDTAGTSHIAILSQHNQARMCLLVMCGLPGAGKTTLTQRLQQVFTQRAVIQTRNVHSTCNEQRMPHTSWSTAGRVRCSTVCFDQVERSAGSRCYAGSTCTYCLVVTLACLAICSSKAKPRKQQIPASRLASKLCHS